MPFAPSQYQQAVFDFVSAGQGSALVTAVAGAGKTTTCLHALSLTKGTVSFLAFNKKIADEMKAKKDDEGRVLLPPHVRAQTFHSVGFSAWNFMKNKSVDVSKDKLRDLIDQHFGDQEARTYGVFACKLASLAKQIGMGFLSPDSPDVWAQLIDHYDVSLDSDRGSEAEGVEVARKLLKLSIEAADAKPSLIDFDDMLYMPLLRNARFFPHDWVFVDEAQDTNAIQLAMLRRMLKPSGRLIAVGDRCQPTGTIIETTTGPKKIEDLRVGDKVISIAKDDGTFPRCGRRINGITKRRYRGGMVVVASNGRASRYTPNHFCYARYAAIGNRWAVYVMRKGNWWRIGTSKMRHNSVKGCGPMIRKRLEGADDLWILDTFATERDAKLQEFVLSTQYGIPEMLFNSSSEDQYRGAHQELINERWTALDTNRLTDAAHECIRSHGRDPLYPFSEMASKPGEFWLTRPVKVRACNLLNGVEVLHYENRAHYSREDFHAALISIEPYSGYVYSMDVERDHSYVADGIATFNCQAVYGFRGADSEAMDNIKHAFNCIELPLTISYRCAQSVVRQAQTLVPYIEASPTAPEGRVRNWYADQKEGECVEPTFSAGDAIICRNTAPLIQQAYSLIGRGVGCKVLGREIGDGLIKLIEKMKARGIDQLVTKLEAWAQRESAKFIAKGQEQKAEAVNDKYEAIRAVIEYLDENNRTVPALIGKLQAMFSDDNDARMVILATAHKSKGLEWRRVYVLAPELMPSKWARQEWQQEQEKNVQYVCWTRAKEELVFLR